MTTPETDLRSLVARPFDLLRELERRSLAASAGGGKTGAAATEWVGVAFRVGDHHLLAAREEVREVLPIPATTRVPGAVFWVRGLANVRGQLLPLTDLQALLEGEKTRDYRSSRVLVVNHRQIPAGIIVDEVFGFRRFIDAERVTPAEQDGSPYEPFVTRAYARDGQISTVIGLIQLVESERFLRAAE